MKKIYAIGIILLLVWLIVQFPHVMINPGELQEEHQVMNDRCFDCHDPFMGVSSDKCIVCHKLSEIGKDSPDDSASVAFHSKLAVMNCTSCHTDHQGLHPTGATMHFDHSLLSETDRMNCNNCHTPINDSLHRMLNPSCSGCHSTESWSMSPTFDHNLVHPEQKDNCITCHKKPANAFHVPITTGCPECHSTAAWVPSTFDHSSYFALDNNHNATCQTCHTDNIFTDYTCYGCHEHSENNIKAEHQEEGITDVSNCVSCHRSGSDDESGEHGESMNGNNNDAEQIKQYLDKQEGQSRDDDD